MKKIIIMVLAATLICPTKLCAQKKQSKKTPVEVKKDTLTSLTEKATAGDAVAQNTLGTWYYTGNLVRKNYKTALDWWTKSAKQDNVDAIANMAMCYQLGNGIKKDSLMAFKLYESAVKKGNITVLKQHAAIVENTGSLFSSLLLNDIYNKGIGVKRDQKKAVYYLTKAAEANSVESQKNLGMYLLNSKNHQEAAKWFKRAAAKGNLTSTYYYGYLAYHGMGIPQDKSLGLEYIQKAADRGFIRADYLLGTAYLNGDGIGKDADKAFSHLLKAAEGNVADAKWLVAMCYLNGEGTEQDYHKAVQWMAEVALKSHQQQIKQLAENDKDFKLSNYLWGLKRYYVEKDYPAALGYFKKTEKVKIAEGTTMQGLCLVTDGYSKHNAKKAVKMLTKATAHSPYACYLLGSMYEKGNGVEKNSAKAFDWIQKAADKDIPEALCKLGDAYMEGNHVSKDYAKAATCYLKAEKQGYLSLESAKNLIRCYNLNISALPDLNHAKERIEALRKIKVNENVVEFLKTVE